MDGIINILKPPNMTSHDVVGFLRKLFKEKKIGHTGTLDPNAVGVLPICIGKATKLVDDITAKRKRYRAQLMLGAVTDTQDSTGSIITANEVNIGKDDLIEVLKKFTGIIHQIPPMYSAIKQDGRKLYELAREGKVVERKAREIEIFEISLIYFDDINNSAIIDVLCSKGTYIRTLCNDIGERLGCGGHMGFLIRLQSGNFDISSSLTLDEVSELYRNNDIHKALILPDDIFENYPKVKIKESSLKWIQNGAQIFEKDIEGYDQRSECIRVYDSKNNFLAIYKLLTEDNRKKFIPEKMFL